MKIHENVIVISTKYIEINIIYNNNALFVIKIQLHQNTYLNKYCIYLLYPYLNRGII